GHACRDTTCQQNDYAFRRQLKDSNREKTQEGPAFALKVKTRKPKMLDFFVQVASHVLGRTGHTSRAISKVEVAVSAAGVVRAIKNSKECGFQHKRPAKGPRLLCPSNRKKKRAGRSDSYASC